VAIDGATFTAGLCAEQTNAGTAGQAATQAGRRPCVCARAETTQCRAGYYFKRADNIDADNQSGKLPAPACNLEQAAAQGMQLHACNRLRANLPLLQDPQRVAAISCPMWCDGVIRTLPLLMEFQGRCYETLALAMLRRIVEAPQLTVWRGRSLEQP